MDIASIGFGIALGYSLGSVITGTALYGAHWDDMLAEAEGDRLVARISLIIFCLCWPWVLAYSIEAAHYDELADLTGDDGDQAGA